MKSVLKTADGRKLRTRHSTAVDGLSVSLGHTLELTDQTLLQRDSVDYMGPFEVKRGIHQFGIYQISMTEMRYRFDGGFILRSPRVVPGQMHPLVQYSSSFHYYLRDHLGNVRVVVNDSAIVEQSNHYYALGGPWGDLDTEQGFQPYKYNGKELDRMHGLDLYDYGARLYDPAIGLFTSMDPLCEKYYHLSPYSYCGGDPVNRIDPFGEDPIYARRRGRIRKIGDDGKNGTGSYLVMGSVARRVAKATKLDLPYTGSLAESRNVFHIPTGGILQDVVQSVEDSRRTQHEQGGHYNYGDVRATRWNEGGEPTAQKGRDYDVLSMNIRAFQINGQDLTPSDASQLQGWWHVHPNREFDGKQMGNAEPSLSDINKQKELWAKGFRGNSFVIGDYEHKVTFFDRWDKLETITWADFLRMGRRE